MVDVRARLPKEEAAVLLAAIDAAKDQFGPPPPKPDPCGRLSAVETRAGCRGLQQAPMLCWMWPGCS